MEAIFKSTPPPSGNRIEWLDCIKAMTIVLVIYFHLILGIDKSSAVVAFFTIFFMTIFFFLSGFTSYKIIDNLHLVEEKIGQRFLSLLLPSIVTGTLCCLVKDRPITTLYTDEVRAGYWFTFSLFYIYTIYIILEFICRNRSTKFKTLFYICLAFIWMGANVIALKYYSLSLPAQLFGIDRTTRYAGFFLLGIVASMHKDKFMELIKSNLVCAISLLIFVIGFVSYWNLDMPNYIKTITFFPISIFAIVAIIRIFYFFRDSLSTQTKGGGLLCYIGRKTLSIYLFHWFFLTAVINFIKDTSFLTGIFSSWFSELIIVSFLAIIITFACLAVEKLIQAFPVIHGLLLGFDIKKKQ